MTALTTGGGSPGQLVPRGVALPEVPPSVAAAVAELERPRLRGVPAGKSPDDLTPEERERTWLEPLPDLDSLRDEEREAAASRASVLDRLLSEQARVSPALFREWLKPLMLGSRNPPPPDAFGIQATAMFTLLADLPAAAFTAETQRLVAARSPFCPGAADIRAVLQSVANGWVRERDLLRRCSMRRWAPPVAPEPSLVATTAEEAAARKAAVAKTLARFKTDMEQVRAKREGSLGSDHKRLVSSRHLSPLQQVMGLVEVLRKGPVPELEPLLRLRLGTLLKQHPEIADRIGLDRSAVETLR
jgi:hypothetical protein